METVQAVLTPTANNAPAVADIPAKELSGAQWVARFPGSASVDECIAPFKANLNLFIAALKAAGATVSVAATYRPANRAYLMHWSWEIVKSDADPKTIPSKEGVDINWDHGDKAKSVQAAQAMLSGYGMQRLRVSPALSSKHIDREAVDMSIAWTGDLAIKNADGTTTTIKSEPKTEMNADLKTVGATYSVMKYVGGDADEPHWSSNGH
jgi:hypothetical protein